MKYILFFVLLSTLLCSCATLGFNAKSIRTGAWSGNVPELIMDAWIKGYDHGVPDTLVVRTERISYFPTKIPVSERIKFTIRIGVVDTVFLESSKQNKKMFYIFSLDKWSKLKPLHN